MPKLYQRKSLLTLLLCIAFANCGSSAKKDAAAAPAESNVSLADASKARAMKNTVLPEEKKKDDNLDDGATEQPAPDITADNSTTPTTTPIVRTLTPYEQSNTAPVYVPAASPIKQAESTESKTKREEAEAKKKATAAAIVSNYEATKKKAAEDKIKADQEAADKKKSEEKAAAAAEEDLRQKQLQDDLERKSQEAKEEQRKLDEQKKLLEGTPPTPQDSTSKTPPVTPVIPAVDSTSTVTTPETGSVTLPADSTTIKSVATTKNSADAGDNRMTDILEDLSEALLATSPGSTAESENLSKIFSEFNNITANFDSMDHRLKNIFLMAQKNEHFAKALQEKTPFRNSTTNESKILGPLWYAFQVQAKATGQKPDSKIIDVYQDSQRGISTITIATAYFPQDRWEEKSSRTKDAKKQLQQFRQVWNALVASGYNLTNGYPTIVGLSNKDNDNMMLPCNLVRSFLIEEDKNAGITNSNFSLFGEETITTGNYWTSKKQRRVEIRIADVSSITVTQ
jgi:hypothetical protein